MGKKLGFIALFLGLYSLPITSHGVHNTAQKNKGFANPVTTHDSLYKTIEPRSLEHATALEGLALIIPEDEEWNLLGQAIATTLQQKANVSVTLSAPNPELFAKGWSGNTLLIGNLGNNIQMARLYGLRFSYADAVYPGPGGYQLLTLIDPFGLGGNTICISASDLEGASLGVKQLLAIIDKEKDAEIPWLFQARLPKTTSNYFNGYSTLSDKGEHKKLQADADSLLKKLQPVVDNESIARALLAVLSQAKLYGEYYQLTCHATFGELYRRLLKGYADFLNRYPTEARHQLESRRNMWVQGEKLFQQWAVLEASPLFNDRDRREILSALYLTCEANASDGYLVKARERAPRWNHEVFPALSLIGSCQYFENHYQLPEISKWKARGDRIFAGNTSHISLDEGSDYLVHVPMTNIDYGMATGKLPYIHRSLRPSADLHTLMIDNLGTLSGGGDTYPFGMSSAYSWGHSQVLNAAAWLYQDPLYDFLLARTRQGPFPKQKMPDLHYPIHRYKANLNPAERLSDRDYPRLQAQAVEPALYHDLQEKGVLNIEQKDTFHKLTFRSGFGQDDNYLIVDGFSAGRHGHQDGNAILKYSANSRLFLVDRDYIQNTPVYHSNVVIIKNGEQHKKPPLAKLEWASDLEGTSISRSQVMGYNGTDWSRTIINPGGRFFLIYDDLHINEAGTYILKNLWQSLGTPTIDQQTFKVEQQGVTMLLQNMSKSDLRLKDIYGHFIKYWKTVYPYPYADHETVLTEVIDEKPYRAGDKTAFINVLSSHKGNHTPIKAVRLQENLIAIDDGQESWLVQQGPLDHGLFSSDGAFHLLGNDVLIAASVTRIKIGSKTLNFPVPIFFSMDTRSGAWKTYDLLKDKITYTAEGKPVQHTAIDQGTLPLNSSMFRQFKQMLHQQAPFPTEEQKAPLATALTEGWKKTYTLPEQVSSSAIGDLDGDGKDELVLAGIHGLVTAIDAGGKEQWTFKAKGRVNEVSVQRVADKPLIFIATENWYVHALNASGEELWSYRFPDDTEHKEYKGNLIGITRVRLAQLHGKNHPPSVMVGTQFRYLYELDLKGNYKADTALYFYGIEDMAYADLDDDGKEEGIFALEYYYYTLLKDKKLLTGTVGGPGWKVAAVLRKQGRDSLTSMLLGSKQSEVRRIQYRGKLQELWVRNVGGEVNDIVTGDFNQDGHDEILVGSEGFQFYVLDPQGRPLLRKSLGDRVTHVNGFRREGEVRYLAATAQGGLYTFSENGEAQASVQVPGEIENIPVGGNGGHPWLILKNGEVYTMD